MFPPESMCPVLNLRAALLVFFYYYKAFILIPENKLRAINIQLEYLVYNVDLQFYKDQTAIELKNTKKKPIEQHFFVIIS